VAPNDPPGAKPGSRLRFIAALEGLKGPGFLFHPDVENQIERSNRHIFEWAEQRLEHSLPHGANQTDRGIRIEADLLTLTPEELAQFADFAAQFGVLDVSSKSDSQAVAEAVRNIRQRVSAN
jgi:hypothetical protein